MKPFKLVWVISLFFILAGFSVISAAARSADSIIAQIERLASFGTKGDQDLSKAIAGQIEDHPKGVAPRLLPKLKDPAAPESQLATYAWALGWCKDASASDALISLHRGSKSEWVRHNCIRALAMIGGKPAGEYLMSVLDETTDKDGRYEILNLLCEMQYEPGLSRTDEVLREDSKEYYWKPIFLFGKMGDMAVPFLLRRINDENLNVRTHAIHVLGQWLAAPEATQPLEDHFWTEKDEDLRIAVLSSLERTFTDLDQIKIFFERVVANDKSEKVVKFAKETLAYLDKISAAITEFVKKKKVSPADFGREYSRLFKSTGHEGDYDILGVSSTLEDEPKLKALKEHILLRDSDESFDDYQKVNNIIMFNRLAARLKRKYTEARAPAFCLRAPTC
jgi:hypothetical protein